MTYWILALAETNGPGPTLTGRLMWKGTEARQGLTFQNTFSVSIGSSMVAGGWVAIINQLCCYIEEDGFVCE